MYSLSFDFHQELEDGRVVFVESNKLTVRFHTIDPDTIKCLKSNLRLKEVDILFFEVQPKSLQRPASSC